MLLHKKAQCENLTQCARFSARFSGTIVLGSTLCLILAGCFDNSACKSGGGVQMHLINYLQPIYASLVAGHVFCTRNGM